MAHAARMALVLAAILAAWLPTSTAADASPSAADPGHRREIYLLLGQSNMAGRGRVAEQDRAVHPRVFAFDARGRWVPAHDPLDPQAPTTDTGEVRGVGPGMTFARVMAEAEPEAEIGLVPCAVGGSMIRDWRRGRLHYRAALERARAAARSGVLRGVLWHQGENDAFQLRSAERYAAQLDALVRELREDLGDTLPFVAGRIADRGGPADLVNAAIAGLPERVPRTAVVAVADLPTEGPWHFTAEGARELGRRYAAAMLRLLAETDAERPARGAAAEAR